MDDFLPAVQFGVTLAALALGWIGEPALAEVFSRAAAMALPRLPANLAVYSNAAAIVVAFALITYFEVLLGELVPKSLALQRAERIALAVSGPMDVFIRITRPAVRLMNGSAALVLRLFKAPLRAEGSAHSPEELKLIATATRRMGLLPSFQEEIIHRAIELSHVVVREIMTPRGSIFALPADLPLEQASARIVGIVHSKDVARLMHFRVAALTFGAKGASGLTLRALMREVLFVPETKLAVELLQEFQERRRQIAIVVDEFGSTVGLVTAEDALEQVVGELRDEFDEIDDSDPVRMAAASTAAESLLLEGSTTLRDLSTRLGWEFPRRPGVETLAGFLLAELGHIPVVGERVLHDRREFLIVDMAGRRISKVRVEERRAGVNTGTAGEAQATEDDGLEVSA
jgi:CBS domain containing-hemolysin-like protein